MGIAENQTFFSHIEYSSVVKDSGIKKQVHETIFKSLNQQELKEKGDIEIHKNGTSFKLMPVLSDIYRFIATDRASGISEHITVTEDFIEDKIVDAGGKKISHLWNSPQALKRVSGLLQIYSSFEGLPVQEVLFEN